MNRDVIIALDFARSQEVFEFLNKFGDRRPYVKVGMELYFSEGPDIVRELKKRGHKVFLDLKLCDIPNTVRSAMKVIASLNVDMTNVHIYGGQTMMKWAVEGLDSSAGEKPILLGITQLTSTSEKQMNEELLIQGNINDVIVKYAEKAKCAGLSGVVCSPLEAKLIHEKCGKDFLTVTPGIRFGGAMICDQKRITTPAQAGEESDFIVMGRPITEAMNPLAAYDRALKEFLGQISKI